MRCVRCRAAPFCKEHSAIRLVNRDSLERTMWLNEHVISHYRPMHLPARLCIKSIFHWTNETINVWSHLLGFVFFTYRQLYANFVLLPEIGASRLDHLVFSISIFCSQACMLLSACYHTFGCHSRRSRVTWLKLDIFGISAGLLGMYLMGIYTSFFCFEEWLRSYLTVLAGLFVVIASVPLQGSLLNSPLTPSAPRFTWLHVIFTTVALFGLAPTLHWCSLHGGLASEHVLEWLPNIAVVYGLTAAAFFFYISMFPERVKPGLFDVVGCSHQWWHLLILAAMITWQTAGLRLLERIRTTDDFCHTVLPGIQGEYEGFNGATLPCSKLADNATCY